MPSFSLRMKTINILKKPLSLAEVMAAAKKGPLVLTDGRRPLVLLQDVEGNDLESIALGLNPAFIDMLAESRARQKIEGGTCTLEEMRRLLGIERTPDSNGAVAKRPKRKVKRG